MEMAKNMRTGINDICKVVDVLPEKKCFCRSFSGKLHAGRPGLGLGLGLGLGFGLIGFVAFFPKSFIVILNHMPYTRKVSFFPYCVLYHVPGHVFLIWPAQAAHCCRELFLDD